MNVCSVITAFVIIVCIQNPVHGMLCRHPLFHRLPLSLQGMYKGYPQDEHLRPILDGIEKRIYPQDLTLYVWRMALHQGLSFQTAEHALENVYRIFNGEYMVNDVPLNWDEEYYNKKRLIEALNCPRVRHYCLNEKSFNDTYSLVLQEYAHIIHNPHSLFGFLDRSVVKHAAHHAGCKNPACCDVIGVRSVLTDEQHKACLKE